MSDPTPYLTVVFADGWTCNCPAPAKPARDARMTAQEALVDADNHVSTYRDTWPHVAMMGSRWDRSDWVV